MSRLATWFIFELIGVGAAPDLSEPQAFKNVSLLLMIDKTFTFHRKFHKNLHHIQVFDVRYEWQSGSGSGIFFTASRFRLHKNLPLPASASTSLL